jgi:hypothetical protein
MGRNNKDFRVALTKEYWDANMKREQASQDDYDPHGVYNRDHSSDHEHTRAADAEMGDL